MLLAYRKKKGIKGRRKIGKEEEWEKEKIISLNHRSCTRCSSHTVAPTNHTKLSKFNNNLKALLLTSVKITTLDIDPSPSTKHFLQEDKCKQSNTVGWF